MAENWKPGDVAIATIYGHEVRVVRGHRAWITTPAPEGRDFPATYSAIYDNSGEVKSARRLVVIDPEDDDTLRKFAAWTADGDYAEWRIEWVRNFLNSLANPTPPKPEEPTGLGAVVEDASGVRWVLAPADGNSVQTEWVCSHSTCRTWGAIDAVRVLSEGVTP